MRIAAIVDNRHAVLLAWVLAPSIFLPSCGILGWREVYSSDQPHGNARVTVDELCGLADCSVRIVAARGWHRAQIASRRGCIVNFAQVAWEGDVAGVFVDGGYCQQMKVAWDTASGRLVPFATVGGAVRAAIVKDYDVSANELKSAHDDACEWATYPGNGTGYRAMDEFGRRYPH